MNAPIFSIVIPAHNEEKYIGKCIEAIRAASAHFDKEAVQIIVSANRCTDETVAISRRMGAEACENTVRCISSVRNQGAALARAGYLFLLMPTAVCPKVP